MTNNFLTRTIKAALLVGTLDILAAFIQFYLKTGKGPAPVLKFIASGIFGKAAFTGGDIMIMYGLLLHFLIAFIFTLLFFFVCAKFPAILQMKFLTGIIYGAFVWAAMNFIVLPLSQVPAAPFNLTNAIIAMSILIICIGLPLAFIANNHTTQGKKSA